MNNVFFWINPVEKSTRYFPQCYVDIGKVTSWHLLVTPLALLESRLPMFSIRVPGRMLWCEVFHSGCWCLSVSSLCKPARGSYNEGPTHDMWHPRAFRNRPASGLWRQSSRGLYSHLLELCNPPNHAMSTSAIVIRLSSGQHAHLWNSRMILMN
jgi:hypothetical protein